MNWNFLGVGACILLIQWIECQADCPASGLDSLSPPVGLTHNLAATDSVPNDFFVTFKCDSNDNMHLEPDLNGDGKFQVQCGSDDFFEVPTAWSQCVKKCQVPGAQPSYKAQPINTPMVNVGSTLTYKCLQPGGLVDGTTSNTHTITCGADGTFPSTAWPECIVRCLIPAPEMSYKASTDVDPVNVGATVTFSCAQSGHTVGETNSGDHVITCGSNGKFPNGWPRCALKCDVPTPEPGFRAQKDNTQVTLGGKLRFYCETEGQTVGSTNDNFHEVTCQENGTFPTGWPECSTKCQVPRDVPGFNNPPNEDPPMQIDETKIYTCQNNLMSTGPSLSNEHEITCMADGTISPEEWPMCEIRCLIPSPQPGYQPQDPAVDPPGYGESLFFECEEAGAKVGNTTSNQHEVTCRGDGLFDMDWPPCSIRCIPPYGEDGYNSQPAGTPTIEVGGELAYSCMETGALSGNTAFTTHTVTCGSDGTFPTGWPPCQIRCAVPEAQAGYEAPADPPGSIDVGESVVFTCATTEAEVGSTQSNQLTLTCGADGSLANIWPPCLIPATCPTPPDLEATNTSLVAKNPIPDPVKAHRKVEYECPDGETTDEGPSIFLACLPDGTYEERAEWPTCRELVACNDSIPIPAPDSGLANSTSTIAVEGDEVEYSCSNSSLKINGEDTFTLTCGSNGLLPDPVNWPICTDPNEAFMSDPVEICHCLGDIDDVDKAKIVLNKVCREGAMTKAFNGKIGVSRKRCGVKDLEAITEANKCFCESPLEQSAKGYWFKVVLVTQPWQWTMNTSHPQNQSYLQTPEHKKFKSLQSKLENAIDEKFFAAGLSKYVRSALHQFTKGQEVPAGVFAEVKPVTEAPKVEPDDQIGTVCPSSLLTKLSIPSHLIRDGSGDVGVGEKAIYTCATGTEVLFTEPGTTGRVFNDLNQVALTCNSDGSAFTGVPSIWPECRAIADQCPILAPAADSGMDPQDPATTAVNVGSILTYSCSNTAHVVAGTNSNTFTTKCGVSGTASDPWYEAKFSDPATWPKCQGSVAMRRKRSISGTGYNYIEVEMQAQFHDPAVSAEDVKGVVDTLQGDLGDELILLSNCDPLVCKVEQKPETCSNEFFEDLPVGYRALTPYGYYQPALAPNLVNANNLVEKGQIVELRCVSTDPMQYPLWDTEDHDGNDKKLTVTCLAPTIPGQRGMWSLSEVPKCASICKQFLPEAEFESDLLLQKVIPIRDPMNPVDYTEYNKTSSFMYSGDKLLYMCKTEYWGLHGGTDEFHDEFGCTDEGLLNTPRGSAFDDPWPHCAPQQQMVVTAVEKMLDRFDRRISDRFKLIQFREIDNEREIVQLSDYVLEVTLPVVLSLLLFVLVVCMCSRPGSPMCKLCESKV
ncbi:uncharacterized protein LOC131881466 isoform X1 [Tigriopus californicus]|uniref:uncharacterized protein LOC131881466 isoform X1 n=1 Tax=Tigriopus californicus TaxID=6832 RepID=UPI0027DA5C43|nr:uncharacterized protein LOC131881466 isoform X1 [Tigriopus californicus]